MKIGIFMVVFFSFAFSCYAQWNNGVIMNVQEVDVNKMKVAKMTGADAVLMIVEQFVDNQYRFAFVSHNYLVPNEKMKNLNLGKEQFIVTVVGYPSLNNLLYTQVFYDKSFFFVVLAKNENDFIKTNDIQIIRMSYEKGNSIRRNNVCDTIQRNNIIPLGIGSAGAYF
jgi:hypothetical protein